MHNANQDCQRAIRKAVGAVFSRPVTALKAVLTNALVSPAANVTLKSNDALGTSSVAGSTNWSNGTGPSSANTCSTTNASGVGLLMRTPTGLANHVFAGDALVLCTNQFYLGGNPATFQPSNNLETAAVATLWREKIALKDTALIPS